MPSNGQTVKVLTGRSYSFRELMAVSGATRKEISDWIKRGIITAERSPGSGYHRRYTWQNVVEATTAKGISRYLRAATIASMLDRIRSLIAEQGIAWDTIYNSELHPGGVVFEAALFGEESIQVRWEPDKKIRDRFAEASWEAYMLRLNLTAVAVTAVRRAARLEINLSAIAADTARSTASLPA